MNERKIKFLSKLPRGERLRVKLVETDNWHDGALWAQANGRPIIAMFVTKENGARTSTVKPAEKYFDIRHRHMDLDLISDD
jgi:hypothetical protein